MASGGSGVKGDAFAGYGNASGQANNAFNTANPIYTQMATNPQGYSPQAMADQEAGSAQSLGGSNAGAVGAGALDSARTNNAGGYQAAIAQAAQQAGAQQSENSLGIQNQNAQLKLQQQQQGLAGLSNEYGTATAAAPGYLNIANNAKPTYLQNLASTATNDALTAATHFAGCWIAEAIYGVDDPRTYAVRAYLNGDFRKTRVGDFIMRLYLRFGERIAAVVRKSSTLRMILRPLFDAALSRALEPLWI
jgi:hypothetical protein